MSFKLIFSSAIIFSAICFGPINILCTLPIYSWDCNCKACNSSHMCLVPAVVAMEQKIHVNPLKILSQTKCTHIQNSSSSCPNQLRRIRMPWILRGRSPPIARSLCKLMQMRQLPRLRLLASSGGHYTPH
ncbi:hypothetical protein ZEAMMB73_Zm00001d019624 [Zea mays]|uniref:Uncharacterized protein n=1 Tax=Zea mays TaxID=4577 RepID=A0A1D6HZB4_MAIZE|nr:hypothetical protein ZEAMMB73_Zm00001d019624 [Zea mays]